MENNNNQKLTAPTAIVVAGVLIMLGIILSGGSNKWFNFKNYSNGSTDKPFSTQVGVNATKFKECMDKTDLNSLLSKASQDADKAMSGIPADQRGTPYSIILGKNGAKAEIRGAYPKEEIFKLIDEVKSGKVSAPYTGEVEGYKEGDHIMGDPNAEIMVIEYSDLECPYCKKFGNTMKEIMNESNGDIAWVYRHWIVHQGALPKAGASECVATLKGNDAFWKYIDLVFSLVKTQEDVQQEELNKL